MKPKLKFLALAALFAAPLLAAWLFFFVHPEWQPDSHTNYGTLVSPARPLPDVAYSDGTGATVGLPTGKWTLVYLAGRDCDASCDQRVLLARQVRLSLNQNRERLLRLYLAPDAAALASARSKLAAAHPDQLFLSAPGAALARFFAPADPQALYLVDPLGNWLMTYGGEIEPRGLLKDLKKLLRFSQVG